MDNLGLVDSLSSDDTNKANDSSKSIKNINTDIKNINRDGVDNSSICIVEVSRDKINHRRKDVNTIRVDNWSINITGIIIYTKDANRISEELESNR